MSESVEITLRLPTSVADLREQIAEIVVLMNVDPPEVGAVHEKVPVREVGGTLVTADVIVPKGEPPYPVLVYLHGGGWVTGSAASTRKLAHRFAEAGYLVMNVDYRLAPEHPFPAAFEDGVDAIRWAARVAGRYGGDARRLAVGGDSAGGNLTAAAVAALADDPTAPKVSAVLLIYAVLDLAPKPERKTEGVPEDVLRATQELMVGAYLGSERSEELLRDPRVSPIHVAGKLPPAHVVCGALDGLVDDAEEVCRRLAAAGIPFERRIVAGMNHGFVQMEMFPEALESIAAMVAFLDRTVKGTA